jgi:hypothetical protein
MLSADVHEGRMFLQDRHITAKSQEADLSMQLAMVMASKATVSILPTAQPLALSKTINWPYYAIP